VRVSELPGLRNEWYAIARTSPRGRPRSEAVTLFGEEYVLFIPAYGTPGLLQPLCPHRGAHLKAADCLAESLRCCYHGWEFDAEGRCVAIPQLDDEMPIPVEANLLRWPVVERYGLYWTCVGTPATDGPPGWPEADSLGWRVQIDFFEPWAASALRIIDNNVDQAHPAFVHRRTFGDPTRPQVAGYALERTPRGFKARIRHAVSGVGPQMGVSEQTASFERLTEVELLSPVQTRVLLSYDGAAPDYCFYGSATPIDDAHSIYVRISALMASAEMQPYDMFWEFSRRVTNEDRFVLETTSPDFPIGIRSELQMRADLTTAEYRRILERLVEQDAQAGAVASAVLDGAVSSRG
jgi:phenylpropionate dioxygenase-like ring-hydroxylating dioxygenase large terminal subunit